MLKILKGNYTHTHTHTHTHFGNCYNMLQKRPPNTQWLTTTGFITNCIDLRVNCGSVDLGWAQLAEQLCSGSGSVSLSHRLWVELRFPLPMFNVRSRLMDLALPGDLIGDQ